MQGGTIVRPTFRHRSFWVALSLVLSLMLAACGGSNSQPAAGGTGQTHTDAPAGGSQSATEPRTLVVANWKDYGSDISWAVAEFEEQTGAKVVHQYFNSLEELLNMLRSGGVGQIDVVLPNIAYVQPAVRDNLLQPIDVSKLSHYEQIYPQLRNLPDTRKDGQVYGVPWTWGITSLAYNTGAFPQPVDSWAALWDPANAGKVAFFDDPATAVMTAALYLGEDPYNPDLEKVKAALIEQKKNVKLYWASADDWTKSFATGAITVGNLWSGLAGTQMANGDPIGFVVPKEGTVGWVDTWAIVKDSPNLDLAYQWIDYMISPGYQARWAQDPDRSSPAPANQEAHGQLPAEVVNRIQSHPEWLDTMVIQRDMPAEQLQAWTELWQEVKATP